MAVFEAAGKTGMASDTDSVIRVVMNGIPHGLHPSQSVVAFPMAGAIEIRLM
jgi:hypothetical protein